MVYKIFNGKKFKRLGVMSCPKCANNWKKSLKKKGKNCRILKTDAGYEVYCA